MNKNSFLALFLSLLITACETTPEKDPSPEVVDKSGGSGISDAGPGDGKTGAGPTVFVPDEEPLTFREELDDPESPLFERIIYFDYDSSTVLVQFRGIIQAHAVALQANPDVVTTLEGHADERGSREYNLALGERRALAVKQQLVVLGVSPNQIRTVSFGEERPAQSGHDEQAWRLNRRVEFQYPN